MSFVQFSSLSLAFGNRDILKNITINLAKGTKAALAGANGSGKTTLMKILCGQTQSDSGTCAKQKDTIVSYLPQSGITHRGKTVLQEADSAFSRGYDLEKELEEIGDALTRQEILDDKKKSALLLERHHHIQTHLEDMQWYHRHIAVEQTLVGLGFSQKDFNRSVEEFSGGWQMRIALAKVLLEKPDILLLDEPTNYLDLEARNWLENYLVDFSGGFLLVSHDRYFLDVTINEVYELFNGELKRYAGNYTQYEKLRAIELESLIARYEQQQIEIQNLEDFVRRFHAKATKAAQAQERQKMLDKMERIEIPESLKKIHFTFPPSPHSGRIVLTINNLNKKYPLANGSVNHVIKDFDFTLEKGNRLVVVGKNGAGKSTLLRILSGCDADFTGEIKLGSGVAIGYFSQDSAETMTGTETIIEMFERETPLDLIPKIRDLLGAFLFRGDDVYKSISVLSGGEKSRLALLRLMLKPINLLILDEPTNHLDLGSKDVLLQALKSFSGTTIFVSHDKGFILELATQVLELTPSRSRLFQGDYQYYLDSSEKNDQLSEENPLELKTTEKLVKSENQQQWQNDKKRKAEIRRLIKEEEILVDEIDLLDTTIAALEEKLSLPEVYSSGEQCKIVQAEIEAHKNQLDEKTSRWAQIGELLSELES
ncbi:MAG: ABC-F family ATP-binding cassette domain-containing protein [Treponemataceae bacterium]